MGYFSLPMAHHGGMVLCTSPVKGGVPGARQGPGSLLEREAIFPACIGRNVQKPSRIHKHIVVLQLWRLLPTLDA